MGMRTLQALAEALNSTYRNMEVRQEAELESATWEETVEEVNKGWVWFDEGGDNVLQVCWSTLWNQTAQQDKSH